MEEQIQTHEEEQREKLFQESIDEKGDWKSLGHFQNYTGELISNLPPDAPDPYHYMVDEEERFRQDLSIYRQKSAIKEGIREALTPPLDQLPDDEYAGIRKEAETWKERYLKKAEEAEKDGDLVEAKKWRDISKYKERDLEALGPSKREQVIDEIRSNITANAITLLGEQRLDNDPIWDHPKMQHDAAIEIGRFNQDRRHKILLVPKEVEPWGEILPIKPSNMVLFELPEAALKEARRWIYSDPSVRDPKTLFKKTWEFLRQAGYAQEAKPTVIRQGGK